MACITFSSSLVFPNELGKKKSPLVIKQDLIHLETVKLRVFAHECERLGSEISLASLAAAAAGEPKTRGFPHI